MQLLASLPKQWPADESFVAASFEAESPSGASFGLESRPPVSAAPPLPTPPVPKVPTPPDVVVPRQPPLEHCGHE